ncbi:hypothetical protein Y032_0279g1196 [Ancylostoma ceylanicum]|uniref:MADF domain-containing protein n=1 Tax=Ancylostoma ceylanicum TaxID=53326 RepID=A0A016S7U5_9BILA|nr:hypothetical protein Y032_0279g1196 [Ancylostoma ceylanicum]
MSFREYVASYIEEERCLWDPMDESYRLKGEKFCAWERISKKLAKKGFRCSLDEIKKTWKNMRDTYKRYQNAPSGSAARPWALVDSLRFLDAADIEGTRLTNVDASLLSDSDVDDFDDEPVKLLGKRSPLPLLNEKKKKPKLQTEMNSIKNAANEVTQRIANLKEADRYTHFGECDNVYSNFACRQYYFHSRKPHSHIFKSAPR